MGMLWKMYHWNKQNQTAAFYDEQERRMAKEAKAKEAAQEH